MRQSFSENLTARNPVITAIAAMLKKPSYIISLAVKSPKLAAL